MRQAIRYLGALIAVGFMALILWQSAWEIPALTWTAPHVLSGLGLGLALYVLSQFIGAHAWRWCLTIYNVGLPYGVAESQLLVSQIGKYIPGNFAHLLGRSDLARTDGVGGASIAGALALEIGFLFLGGSLVVASAFWFDPGLLTQLSAFIPDDRAALAAGVVGLLVLSVVASQVVFWRMAGCPYIAGPRIAMPVALHMMNFLLLGVSLWSVAKVMEPTAALTVPTCIAIFAVAWVAGFVMPGAPGGIGLRDGIITLGLGLFMGAGAALGAALLHRIVSVLGDVSAFAIGLALRNVLSNHALKHR